MSAKIDTTLSVSHLGVQAPSREGSFFEIKLLTYKQAAQHLSVSVPYLRKLKAGGKIPFVQIGLRGVRFRLGSLNQWIEKREVK